LAVDAGSHLAAITRILKNDFPLVSNHDEKSDLRRISSRESDLAEGGGAETIDDNGSATSSLEAPMTVLESGPFSGLDFPHASARANAVHVVREHVATYLITHPHLDHLSGFAINTAAFHNTSRPKRLAALPFTVNAIKNHIFNDVIWPNLTDEDNGVGFVTFQRLTEGGNLALGEGESRGYIEVCEGLAVKAFRVSHGRCASSPPVAAIDQPRRGSVPGPLEPSWQAHGHTQAQAHNGSARTPVADVAARRTSILSLTSQPGTPTYYSQQSTTGGVTTEHVSCIVDSSAFFIQAGSSGKEVLIFGDVEPDSISPHPRTHLIWAEAAPKIAQGHLTGIFIECSYADSQADAVLFGHLAPRHLIDELLVLADMVAAVRREHSPGVASGGRDKSGRKRKRKSFGNAPSLLPGEENVVAIGKRSRSHSHATAMQTGTLRAISSLRKEDTGVVDASMDDSDGAVQPQPAATVVDRGRRPPYSAPAQLDSPTVTRFALDATDAGGSARENSLRGLRVVVIHVKDNMTDGPPVGETILRELHAHEEQLTAMGKGLGCVFEISTEGASYYF
jgi:elongation factor 1-gamma